MNQKNMDYTALESPILAHHIMLSISKMVTVVAPEKVMSMPE
jgi:hypothetical protein